MGTPRPSAPAADTDTDTDGHAKQVPRGLAAHLASLPSDKAETPDTHAAAETVRQNLQQRVASTCLPSPAKPGDCKYKD